MGGLKHCLSLRCLVASFMLISRCAPRGLSEYKSAQHLHRSKRQEVLMMKKATRLRLLITVAIALLVSVMVESCGSSKTIRMGLLSLSSQS